MIDLDLFFPIPRGRCHGNQFWANRHLTFILQAGVRNGVEYDSSDSKLFNGNIVATFCENLMKIGRVIPKITRVTSVSFCMTKMGISQQLSQKVLRKYSLNFQLW